MGPANNGTGPPGPPVHTSPMDPDYEARLKAEARAYALSSTSSTKSSKRKLHSMKTSLPATGQRPTSLSIHRPERPQKLHKPNFVNKAVPTSAPVPPTAQPSFLRVFDESDDDYERFVKSLGLDDSLFAALDNDDEEFHLSDIEEEDDEEEEDDGTETEVTGANSKAAQAEEASTPTLSSPLSSSPMTLPDLDSDLYRSLEEELGSLLEEEMEAAVQSLMTSKKPTVPSPSSANASSSTSPKTPKSASKKAPNPSTSKNSFTSPATPLRESARQGTRAQVTYQQAQQLRRLLTRHYQLLVQQAVLAVRAAQMQKLHKDKSDFLSGENSDDLAEILDGAVGMLQDLDQNRKDAIRNSIQLTTASGASTKGRRSLMPQFTELPEKKTQEEGARDRRLTRAAFSKTLEQNGVAGAERTAFDIPGLVKLRNTFITIDKSVEGVKGCTNVLESATHTEACKIVLREAGAHVDESYIPGMNDLTENFCNAKEVFGDDFRAPCSEEQNFFLRRNRNLFTSGEDNLVLRGVNLYGEKQWILIADRYLPDRSVNIISQRYSKLCVMMYKAHGIEIDNKGNLIEPPKLESVDDIDETRVKELELATAEPPAILNVHRWSLEEDLTLLKAVPIMGHMWAELGARLIPHRDRGHLRKRYQVLERRVKATVARSSKEFIGLKLPKQQNSLRKADTASNESRPQPLKPAANPPAARKGSGRSQAAIEPPMTIEKAAASLATLRPPARKPLDMPKSTSTKKRDHLRPETKKISPPTVARKVQEYPQLPEENFSPNKVFAGEKSQIDLHLNDPTLSRTAFERLVEGTSEEWSQMSRMKSMMENDAESQAADAIVSQLAKSPGRHSTMSRLPQIQIDGNSGSGFSILQSEATAQTTHPAEKKRSASEGASIMSRIIRGSSKETEAELDTGGEKYTETNKKVEEKSPSKRSFKSTSQASTTAPPMTPKRTDFFSESDTPIGLSPSFRPSPGILREGGAIRLTPNYNFSPSSTVMRLMAEPSGDEIRFCDFQINDDSRKSTEDEPAKQTHDPTPPPLTPSKNSLMIEEFDAIEAMSALNSLSNSPFRHSKREDENTAREGKQKSLFASVVGGVKDRDTKTRLEF